MAGKASTRCCIRTSSSFTPASRRSFNARRGTLLAAQGDIRLDAHHPSRCRRPDHPRACQRRAVRSLFATNGAAGGRVRQDRLGQDVRGCGRRFRTLLTPFLSTLNNHTVATMCVLFTMVSVVEIWRRTPRQRGGLADEPSATPWQLHAAAGFFASFAVCNELPALAFAAAVFVLLFYWAPWPALVFFLGAALVPVSRVFRDQRCRGWTIASSVQRVRQSVVRVRGELLGKPFPGQRPPVLIGPACTSHAPPMCFTSCSDTTACFR